MTLAAPDDGRIQCPECHGINACHPDCTRTFPPAGWDDDKDGQDA